MDRYRHLQSGAGIDALSWGRYTGCGIAGLGLLKISSLVPQKKIFFIASIVQWRGHNSSKVVIWVRILVGAPDISAKAV